MLKFGICELTLIPVRKEPSERSEMVTQLLFGETAEIIETQNSWSYIACHHDGYNGWVTTKMLTLSDQESFTLFQNAPKSFLKEPLARVVPLTNPSTVLYLAGGSTLAEKDNCIVVGDHLFTMEHNLNLHRPDSVPDITGTALKFLHSPYLWGGRTLFGMDCSGLTQIVFKMNGITIPRDASQQAKIGRPVPSTEEAKPGDVAFFRNGEGRIVHTGIILENSEIIHASGKVRIDKIDNIGIYNTEINEYSHKLDFIKRIL